MNPYRARKGSKGMREQQRHTATHMDGTCPPLTASSPMEATTQGNHTSGRRASPRADSTGVHHRAAGNGDIDWQLLELCWRKGQWIIAEHNDVSEFPHLDAAEDLFLEARVRSVDSLTAQGLRHGQRLTSRDL